MKNPEPLSQQTLPSKQTSRYSPEARERQRQIALRDRPWQYSTGPRTPAGKAKVALNGKRRQKGPHSVRELQRSVAEITDLVQALQASRQLLQHQGSSPAAAGQTQAAAPDSGIVPG